VSESIAEFRVELRRAAERRVRTHRRRRRAGLVALALVAATAATGITAAATGWLHGTPAPPEVINDFRSYTPQLGFHPKSGKAELVARDGDDYLLYATENREGTYCVVTSSPAMRPGQLDDGGTCVPESDAREPIAVGIGPGGGPKLTERTRILSVIGRVQVDGARSIEFTDQVGTDVQRALGADAFYIAAVPVTICPDDSWRPTFVARDADGDEVARATIPLIWVRHDLHGVCGFGVAPHGPAANVRLG
jgi:hypothetical protein